MTARFSNQLVAEVYQPFWAARRTGEFLTDSAAAAGTHRHRGLAFVYLDIKTDDAADGATGDATGWAHPDIWAPPSGL